MDRELRVLEAVSLAGGVDRSGMPDKAVVIRKRPDDAGMVTIRIDLDQAKTDLAEKICLALKVHAQIEEEIFYPQAREASRDNDLIDEALVEHSTVKNLIGEIEAMEVGEELYDAKIRVLGEMVKQHIKEEEEELFPELQSTKMDLDAVGKVLAERKEDLMAEMQA